MNTATSANKVREGFTITELVVVILGIIWLLLPVAGVLPDTSAPDSSSAAAPRAASSVLHAARVGCAHALR